MILKYTWHGAILEAIEVAKATGRQQRVRKTIPPGAKRMWWIIEPATIVHDELTRDQVEVLKRQWLGVEYVPPSRTFLGRALRRAERA